MPPPAADDQAGTACRPSRRPVDWHWATPQAQRILADGHLGEILRFHRSIHSLSQAQLADILGYDKTYISALETGKRALDDVGSLRRVCALLHVPPHVLGITDPADSDHRAMLQFGESTVRLAEIARQSGHAAEAVAELWPLAARLEARIADGHNEPDVLRLLARTHTCLGVALGNVWTAKSVQIARHFDNPELSTHALRMHGNELRKAGLRGAAVTRLRQAVFLAPDRDGRAAALPLLARAAGATGDARLFDQVMHECKVLLDQVRHTSLFNPFALHEIQLRCLIATGRANAAIRLAANGPTHTSTVAPQWRVIELVTIAHVHLLAYDRSTARQSLDTAIQEATLQRLPHQLQRITRIAGDLLPDTRTAASQALEQLRKELAA
jgi:transcriptional regulator with XRE-family HTH domain